MDAIARPRRVGALAVLMLAAQLLGARARAQAPEPLPEGPERRLPAPTAPESHGLGRWFNPSSAPFIPIPEIGTDPDSGTTLGIIPTWLETDAEDHIRRIIAPDIMHNPYFGWGVHGRIYAYPSADEQWSLIAAVKQRVERSLVAQFQQDRLRRRPWSLSLVLLYDRDGTPRFYGIGNDSPLRAQTNFTNEQALLQAQCGRNLSPALQLQYTLRLRSVDVLPGTLDRIPSIGTRFPGLTGIGATRTLHNRLALVYDTRDDLTVPHEGAALVLYGGLASHGGIFNESLFSETGFDARGFLPLGPDTVLAAHAALRYLPSSHRLPFWAYSSIGGGLSEIGGPQPLRGYGAGRFVDRNAVTATLELRQRILSLRVVATHLDIEATPFIDVGRVYAGSFGPLASHLHKVGGLAFRGVARPFVVGYVDIGYGNEGTAIFTGINYPF